MFRPFHSVMFLKRISPFVVDIQRFILRSTDIPGFCPSHQSISRLHFASWPSKFVSSKQVFKCRSGLRKYCFTQASSVHSSENEISSTSKQEVFVHGENVPKSCDSFRDIGLEDHVLLELQRLGFEKPTTIQSHCMPIVLTGRDMVGIGQTGSGKTLAYVLPALLHLSKQESSAQESRKPKVLVLAPTRELAQQIQGVVRSFHDIYRVRSTCLYGGTSKMPQMNHLQNGVHICIATPGRLIDLVEMGVADLSQISYLVVDEADRMLDMGFEPQVREIVKRISSPHQTLMWSATWPTDVKELAKDFMKSAVQVTVGSTELMANPNIRQFIHICESDEKEKRLLDLLEEILSSKRNKVLIFAETKRFVDSLARSLTWNKYPASCVHGDKSQLQRDKALHDFRTNNSRVLIATDVAARGLDITDITHIINYDFPNVIETYVHRIGRTARGEKSGTAHSFFTSEDSSLARELADVLMKCNQEVDPELLDMCQRSHSQKKKISPYKREGFGNRDNFFNRNQRSGYQNQNSYQRRPSNRWSNHSQEGYKQKYNNDWD